MEGGGQAGTAVMRVVSPSTFAFHIVRGFGHTRHMRSTQHTASNSRCRFVLGIDLVTLSGRALLVDAASGEEVATASHTYEHGSIEETLPGGRRRLPPEFALQHPNDYLQVLFNA